MKSFLAILFIIVLFEAAAHACLKQNHLTNNNGYYYAAVLAYAVVCMMLVELYSHKDMGSINLICSTLSNVTIMFVGIVFFHEKITNYDVFGALFMFIGLYFIFLKGH